MTPHPSMRLLIKRVLDIELAVIGLLAASPMFVVLSLLILARFGSPILFTQMRPGLHGRPFPMRKFRTMADNRDANGELLPDAQRLTPFGHWLRSTSLDELPELLNVLKGEMSLVGPRPLLMEYLPRYTPRQARRHEVRPGITGWAQVNGRNDLSWEEKFEMDVWYVNHQTLFLDAIVLGRTVRAVLAREGISAEGEATMPRFAGSREHK